MYIQRRKEKERMQKLADRIKKLRECGLTFEEIGRVLKTTKQNIHLLYKKYCK